MTQMNMMNTDNHKKIQKLLKKLLKPEFKCKDFSNKKNLTHHNYQRHQRSIKVTSVKTQPPAVESYSAALSHYYVAV